MTPPLPVGESDLNLARATGFRECVLALRRALTTTPVGWMLAVWFCWGIVPQTSIGPWLGTSAVVWASSLWMLQVVIGNGSGFERYRTRVHWVAGLDGFAWGLMTWFLMGHDPILDATLMALLCGVVAVNAQVYATYPLAYYLQIGTILAVSVLGLLLQVTDHTSATDYAAGLTVFIAIMAYYTREISKRLLEGIRLQRANASLAERLHVAQSPLLRTPVVQVTVSIGVATLAPNQTVDDLLATADASVYAAKNAGRNQVHSSYG